ncbi:ABC transporter ATP-binding protein [Pseudonocardia ailaonensis]|uniref:ABC transporter ATP-binding protein n=1 Tax=Pseudonocardia ailaonensis TaxID=367279 RepID=A0ABN2NNP4_9PSEU
MSAVEAAPAVQVRGLRRAYGERVVLQDVSLDIRTGEVVAMLGRSGVGKSTFLRVLGGFDPDAEGQVVVPDNRAIVFQSPRLLPWLKVLPNVVFGMTDPDRRERGRRALAEVGLLDHAGAWPNTLSGGEAQRTALARALVREPDLLLLDEPFGALDALTRMTMHRLVGELLRVHRPATLLVTHDVDEAIALGDRVVVIDSGRIAVDVSVDLPRPRRRETAEVAALRRRLLRELGVDDAELDG